MKLIIVAGGTGGHIYPGIAIAEKLSKKADVLFIGSYEGLEKDLIKFPIKLIHARGLLRKISWKAISAPFMAIWGYIDAIKILKKFKPDWVISMGGYVSFPVIVAAKLLRIPILLHEQNVLPGATNRFLSKFADIVTLSFSESEKYLKGTVTGNPVRESILSLSKKESQEFTILVFGGSQGARSINMAIGDQIEKLKELNVKIIHIAGKRDYAFLNKHDYPFYHMLSYMYNIEEGYREADIVISRAGATAIAEILACGIPSILIPFPYAAENHQEFNARAVEKHGAAIILNDSDLDDMSKVIGSLIQDRDKLKKMSLAAKDLSRIDAAENIIRLLNAKN